MTPSRRALVFDRAPSSGRALVHLTAGALVVVGVGVVLGSLVQALSPVAAEERALAVIAERRSPPATTFFVVVTAVGNLWIVTLVAALATVCLRRVSGGWQASWLLWAALIGSLLVTAVIKVVVGRARPLEALIAAESGAFPSGHTSRTAAILGLCAWAVIAGARHPAVRTAAAALCAGGIALVGFSRIYLGVHWPTDVAYGLIVGSAWLWVVLTAVRPRVTPGEP